MAPPSLVDLCAKKWKDMEGSTKGRDLSTVTDKHRVTFYEKRFGNPAGVIEEMRVNKVPLKWKQAYEYKEVEIKARGMMRRLVLEEDEYDYCGVGNNGSNSSTRKERDSPKSGEEDEEANEEADIEEFLERGVGGRVYVKEDDEETDIEEFIERVMELVSDEEDEETDIEEEEEQTQIEEVEDDRDGSEVGQEEDGCGDDSDDGSYGNDYSDDGSYGDDYDGDDDYD